MLKRKVTIHEGCLCTTGEILSSSYFQKNETNKCCDGTMLFCFCLVDCWIHRNPRNIRCIFYMQKRQKNQSVFSAFVYRLSFYNWSVLIWISSFEYLFWIFPAELQEQSLSCVQKDRPVTDRSQVQILQEPKFPSASVVRSAFERQMQKHLQCKYKHFQSIYSKLSLWFLLSCFIVFECVNVPRALNRFLRLL